MPAVPDNEKENFLLASKGGAVMKAIMLGTGHALVAKYYNSCFVLDAGDDGCLLVDAGGGSGLLTQFDRAGADWRRIRAMFVSHTHIDHLLGAVWMLRLVCHHLNEGDYQGDFTVYGNDEVIAKLHEVADLLLRPQETRFLVEEGEGAAGEASRESGCVHLVVTRDGEMREALGRRVEFFDIRSKGAKQFGFALDLDSATESGGTCADASAVRPRRIAFCGDEPFNEANRAQVEGAMWLFHEAFCLEAEEAAYDPHPIHHGTVGEACRAAADLGVENLVLFHTEDDTFPNRKALYLEEGRRFFAGNLFVPD